MHYPSSQLRMAVCLTAALALLTSAGQAVAQTDHYLGYQAQEFNKKNDVLGKNCNVTIDDPRFGEKENLNVSKVKALYLPSMKNNEAIIDPNGHLLGFQVKPAKEGIGDPVGKCSSSSTNKSAACTSDDDCIGGTCDKTGFPKGAKHAKRTEKDGNPVTLTNQFGAISVDTNKRDFLLVPTAKDLSSQPDPLGAGSTVDHYLCYKAKETKAPASVPGVEPQQDSKGKLRKGLQVLVGNQFNEGAGHPLTGDKVIYDLKKVTHICNPVSKRNIDSVTIATKKNLPRATDCLVEEANINNGPSMVCYQAKLAAKASGACSHDSGISCKVDKDCGSGNTCDFLPFPHVQIGFPSALPGKKLDPKQNKHVAKSARVTHQFGNPTRVNTKKELEFCVPTLCGNGVQDPGEDCDDGNSSSEDGCSATCQVESCGDGILQAKLGELCDPPASNTCADGGVCSANCLCDLDLGTHEGSLDASRSCMGGSRDGLSCATNPDCPGGRCVPTAHFDVFFAAGGPVLIGPLGFPLIGETFISCDEVDPNTGQAPCQCGLNDIEPVLIGGIGKVCFRGGDPNACPTGVMDCDGGTPMDTDLIFDHNITTCLGPDNDACETVCGIYCDVLAGGAGGYEVHDSQCEGLCQGGTNDGLTCEFDIECPEGSCAGGDPVEHEETCNCSCVKRFGAPSRPGSVMCTSSTGIFVFPEDPNIECFEGAPEITLGDTCIPLTSETASFTYLNFDNNASEPDPNNHPVVRTIPSDTGVPGDCDTFSSSVLSGGLLVGNIGFYDSSLGDLMVPLRLISK